MEGGVYNDGVYNGLQLFKSAFKCLRAWKHSVFLSVCLHCNVVPKGLIIKKDACVGNAGVEFLWKWTETKHAASMDLLMLLQEEQLRIATVLQSEFWDCMTESLLMTSEHHMASWVNDMWRKVLDVNAQ